MMVNTNVIDIICDEFTAEEFIDKTAPLATVIVLNEQYDSGYFIPVSTMAKCGWLDFNDSELIEHTFLSGTTEQGILIRNPRMLVCPKTDLYQYDVKASKENQTKVIVGLYNAELKNDPNIKTERVYLVFFLDQNNNTLHSAPLRYAARGVNGATFELERRAFKGELETCHALNNGVPAKAKNDLFHSLGIFCFTTKAELAGDKQKHWVCRVVGHEKPTAENWRQFFVGYSSLKEYAWTALDPGQKIDILSVPVLEYGDDKAALPAREQLLSQPSVQSEALARASLFQASSNEATVSAEAVRMDEAQSAGVDESEDLNPDIPF